MARLLIYDAYENKVYTYANLNENDPMPYSTLTTLRLREFRGKSASPTLWTTIAAMEAWNLTRRKYGRGIPHSSFSRPQGSVHWACKACHVSRYTMPFTGCSPACCWTARTAAASDAPKRLLSAT